MLYEDSTKLVCEEYYTMFQNRLDVSAESDDVQILL